MASQISLREPKERQSRKIPDDLPWSCGVWPEKGRYRDSYWAALFEMTVRNLRDHVYRVGIPHVPTGRVLWIDATDMAKAFSKVHPSAISRKGGRANGRP